VLFSDQLQKSEMIDVNLRGVWLLFRSKILWFRGIK